ncbi:MAG: regulatory protein [Inoviridae sp.]|nr:MAG: regulatory protein [Inoviridae sp.]
MFPLSLVRSLVLTAINSKTSAVYYEYKTASTHILLTVSINFGTVYYGVTVIKDDANTYLDILSASLDDVLSYGQSENTIYTDVQLLQIYAKHYCLNKTQLAENLGISRPTLNKYLSGSIPLPLIYKKYIALDFGLPFHLLDFEFLSSENYCPLTKQVLNTLPF